MTVSKTLLSQPYFSPLENKANSPPHSEGYFQSGLSQMLHIGKVKCCTLPLVAQRVKNLPALQETWVRSLGREDPLEEGKATHSSILAWRISWTEEAGGLQSTGLQSQT